MTQIFSFPVRPRPDTAASVAAYFDGKPACQFTRDEAWEWYKRLERMDIAYGFSTAERESAKLMLLTVISENCILEIKARFG